MKKSDLNFIVDLLAFIAFIGLTVTGVIMHYSLPPGSGHSRSIWGWNRHDWGNLHFWIAIVLFATLAIHLVLHWKWILNKIKGKAQQSKGYRIALGILGLLVLLSLALAPILSPKQESSSNKSKIHLSKSEENSIVIKGSMTIRQTEGLTGVALDPILEELGLPDHLSKDLRLKDLHDQFGVKVHTLKKKITDQLE